MNMKEWLSNLDTSTHLAYLTDIFSWDQAIIPAVFSKRIFHGVVGFFRMYWLSGATHRSYPL